MTFRNSISVKLSEINQDRIAQQIQEFDGIELRLTGINSEDHSTMTAAISDIEEQELELETVHGTRIPTLGDHPKGASDLMGKARNIEWGYDEQGNRTRRLLEPSAIVYHPPYIEDSNNTRDEMTDAMVHNLEEFIHSDLPPEADIAIENLPTERGILYNTEDVENIEELAEQYGIEEDIAYTFDNVHTEQPIEMIKTMSENDNISNVHLSDYINVDDPKVEELKQKYPAAGTDEGDLLPWRERPQTYTHLPPGEGEAEIQEILNELENQGYTGPVTIELHERFKTEKGIQQTLDEMERLGYPIE